MKTTLKTKPFDAADYLDSPEMIDGFLHEVLASGEPAAIAHALGVVARARGMSQVAKASGLSRENLYRSLSGAHEVNFSTVVRVASALGYEMTLKPKKTMWVRKAGGRFVVRPVRKAHRAARKVAKSRTSP